MKPFKFALAAALVLVGTVLPIHAEIPGADLKTFEKLLEKHCVRCHGPEKSKAELRLDQLDQLDQLDPDLFAGHDTEHWEEVYNQLNIGDMPPEDEEQPTREEREIISAWLNDELDAILGEAKSLNRRLGKRDQEKMDEYLTSVRQ
ncbi:MAG: c-type cytochrome domain-containing protein, partial [Pirellulales bacterium]